MRENNTIITVCLADNEIDRDYERFSISALQDMAKKFVGKKGIIGEDKLGKTQWGRILSCEVRTDNTKITKAGEVYTSLEARVLINNTSENFSLLNKMMSKVQKGSVSCSVAHHICSVCGADDSKYSCVHIKGKMFNGKPAYRILWGVTEVYEWAIERPPEISNCAPEKLININDACKVLSYMMPEPCAACNTELAKCEGCVFNKPYDCTTEEAWLSFFIQRVYGENK